MLEEVGVQVFIKPPGERDLRGPPSHLSNQQQWPGDDYHVYTCTYVYVYIHIHVAGITHIHFFTYVQTCLNHKIAEFFGPEIYYNYNYVIW